jgi:flavin-dependent dehydrogenase
MKYDVVIVGTRVAGAATALLLARRGLRVLAVDRAKFPSDTLSTHQIQLPGGALLRRWGLLDSLPSPPARTVRFDTGSAVLSGCYPAYDGVDAVYSPRRTTLDAMLVDAARAAGAEVRQGFAVSSLLFGQSGSVAGIRGSAKSGGAAETVEAAVVVGADGKNSLVAKAVGAREYNAHPAVAAACYAYYSDLPVQGGEVYARPDRMAGLWPTDDGLTLVFLSVPRTVFDGWRTPTDRAKGFTEQLAGIADLGPRLDAATQAEHLRATSDLPNVFRVPHGPGWALVGDAGLVMDPVTGQGIGNALRDAQAVCDAIVAGLSPGGSLNTALAKVHKQRDADRKPMYDLTTRLASFQPDPTGALLFPAIAADPRYVSDFLGVLTGAVPMRRFFSAGNLRRIVGLRGLVRLAAAKGGRSG